MEPSPNRGPTIEDELNAYLDGELEGETCCRVEERLATDAAYRAEYERLRAAWTMLDSLPRAEVSPRFATTTLEMVALAAQGDGGPRAKWFSRASARPLAAVASLLVAVGLGFATGRMIWPNPNSQVLGDLPILENLDAYEAAGDVEFLDALDREHVLEDDLDER